MKRSTLNLQSIVLASVLSAALLFGVVSGFYGYHTQTANAKTAYVTQQLQPPKDPATTAAPATMLKLTTAGAPVVVPLLKGLYDGKDILLITTEVSDKAMKDQIGNFTGFPVNYAANLTQSQDIGNLWIFKNGVKGPGLMGFQANVVDSIPGDPKYTPLWRVSIVQWKTTSGTTPVVLGSDDAIAQAASKSQVTITPTKVVVNCPILQWGGNKDNTILAGHI